MKCKNFLCVRYVPINKNGCASPLYFAETCQRRLAFNYIQRYTPQIKYLLGDQKKMRRL
jgi:hypothetical protein